MTSPLAAFDRVEPFVVLAAIGSTAAAPVEVATNFSAGFVVRIELTIPNGHNGLTGIAIAQARQRQFPDRAGAYITDNARTLAFPVDDPIGSGQWSAFVYNTSQVPHNFYLRYYVLDLARTRQAGGLAVAPIDFSAG